MPYATIIGVTTLKGFIAAAKIKVSLMKKCSIHWYVVLGTQHAQCTTLYHITSVYSLALP